MIDFLLEIGFEEFPPGFLKNSAIELSTKVENLLKEKKIFYRSVRTIYTPRRIGVLILGLVRKQKTQTIEIQGPPKKVAFDEAGKPTEMLQGFMKANNLKASHVSVKKTEKGEYAFGTKEVAGATTEDILYKHVPEIIRSLEFPKTMVWNSERVRFPRPVRWMVALLDRKPLRFKFAGVEADRYSMANQHFSLKPIRLEKPREYMNFLRHGGVVVDPNERRRIIAKRIKEVASRISGEPVYNDEMLEEINCMTEYPEAVVGDFDTHYLELPTEVLMSVLKNQGDLIWIKGTNKFICVFSAKKKALQNVKKGYTNVVGAKLNDALFYYKNDLKRELHSLLDQTKGMMWLGDLGSLYDKAARLNRFVKTFDVRGLDMKALQRAALLCKADLMSEMVREKDFTDLQGIMGGHYATASGEDATVATAIKDHYLPNFIGDKLPSTKEGAVLSLADKLDNTVGAFLSGNKPSSSYDPLGVRRNGYAVVNLCDVHEIDVSLLDAIDQLVKLYGRDGDKTAIRDFFSERLARYLQDNGFRYDEIGAVLAVWDGKVSDAHKRCEAIKKLRNKPEFTKLVIGQKRVRNILKNIKKIPEIESALFKEPAERKLHQAGHATERQLETMIEQQSYDEVLKLLLELRPVIDTFFDDVLVMCDDTKLRGNRLALVNYINELFLQYADFSQIVIEGENA